MTTRRQALFNIAASGALSLLSLDTKAQTQQLLRIISSGAPGSISDMLARPIAAILSNKDRSVVVENKPGAGGFLASNELLRSPADGNTLMVVGTGSMIWNKFLYKKLPYDPADLVPLASIADIEHVLTVRADFPADNLGEFISVAKKSAHPVTYGFGGTGGPAHVFYARFASIAGVPVTPVAYKSGPPALQDMIGGQIDSMLDGTPLLEPFIKSGKLKALAVASKKRVPTLPDVPTFEELGLKGLDSPIWVGLAVRRGTPKAKIEELNKLVGEAIADPQTQSVFKKTGLIPHRSSVEEVTQFVQNQDSIWSAEFKRNKISID